jgi:hypothetical protein
VRFSIISNESITNKCRISKTSSRSNSQTASILIRIRESKNTSSEGLLTHRQGSRRRVSSNNTRSSRSNNLSETHFRGRWWRRSTTRHRWKSRIIAWLSRIWRNKMKWVIWWGWRNYRRKSSRTATTSRSTNSKKTKKYRSPSKTT